MYNNNMKNTFQSLLTESCLTDLFNDGLSTTGSVGVDGISIQKFKKNLPKEIEVIRRKGSSGTYDFSLYKEKLISKGRDAVPRVISIPTNRDKLVLKALHLFNKQNFADMPQDESIHSKIGDIKKQINTGKYDSFIKLDIKNFFPSIRHDLLLAILRQTISDEIALELIEKAITQSTVAVRDENRDKYQNKRGIPQGLSISSILASILLLDFDRKNGSQADYQYYRFVDDMLILCNKRDVDDICHNIKNDMEIIDLQIHDFSYNTNKSVHGSIADGFQFLGYMFKGNHISVRPSSLDKIYSGINRVFTKHYKYAKERDLDYLYFRLNLKISGCVVDGRQYGWLFFFSCINDEKLLFKLDAHIKRACKRFKVSYEPSRIKKFSRTYHELGKGERSNYIPCFSNINTVQKNLKDIQPEKIRSNGNIIQFKGAKNNIESARLNRIDSAILSDIEADIEFY